MGRLGVYGGLVAILGLLAGSASAGPIYDIDYATYDVHLTDSQRVTTDATDFGYFTGPNILTARRGDSIVEIPFRKIHVIEIGEYIPSRGYSPCTVVSRKGTKYELRIERIEGQRYLGGNTDVGSLRIRLGEISRLELIRLSRTGD